MKNISNKLLLAFSILLLTSFNCKSNVNPIKYLFVTYEPNGKTDCLSEGEQLREDFIQGTKAQVKKLTKNIPTGAIKPQAKFRSFIIEDDYQNLSAQEQVALARQLYNTLLKIKKYSHTPLYIVLSNEDGYELVALASQLFTESNSILSLNPLLGNKRSTGVIELNEAFMNELTLGANTRQYKTKAATTKTKTWKKKRTKQLVESNLKFMPIEALETIEEDDEVEYELPKTLINTIHVVTDKTQKEFFKNVRPAYKNENIDRINFFTTAKSTDQTTSINEISVAAEKKPNKFVSAITCCFGSTAELASHPATHQLIAAGIPLIITAVEAGVSAI